MLTRVERWVVSSRGCPSISATYLMSAPLSSMSVATVCRSSSHACRPRRGLCPSALCETADRGTMESRPTRERCSGYRSATNAGRAGSMLQPRSEEGPFTYGYQGGQEIVPRSWLKFNGFGALLGGVGTLRFAETRVKLLTRRTPHVSPSADGYTMRPGSTEYEIGSHSGKPVARRRPVQVTGTLSAGAGAALAATGQGWGRLVIWHQRPLQLTPS
jgi:hypothetical protein